MTPASGRPTRRALIGALLLAPCLTAPAARAASPRRIVVLDWGLAETLVAMGVAPLGIGEPAGYAARVVTPPLPAGIVDVGLRVMPNLDLLQQLAPDLILAPPWIGPIAAMLGRIAETVTVTIFDGRHSPLAAARAAAFDLGERLGRREAGHALVARSEAAFDAAASRLASRPRSLFGASLIDTAHVAIYGPTSLFGATLTRLGMTNAWTGGTNALGMSITTVEALARDPAASLVCIGPLPQGVEGLAARPIWRDLPAVVARRVVVMPPVWFFGTLPSASRFAGSLAELLSF